MKDEIKSHWHTWVFALTLGIALIIAYKAIDSIGFLGNAFTTFLSIISPILAGLLLAYLIYIPENRIESIYKKSKYKIFRKHARGWGILTTYIILVLIIFIIINVILPVLIESVNELITNIQGYYTKIIDVYNNLPEDSNLKTEQIYNALKDLQNIDLHQYLSIERITGYVKSAVGFATGIFDVFITVAVSIYILAERDEILEFFKRLSRSIFKEETCNKMGQYFNKSNNVFHKFISSQFLDAIIVGILTTVAMKIMGVKYASLLGFTIGLFNMIPYFGAIFAVAISGFITLVTGGFSKALLMLVVVIILQQIDANFINPKIVGESLKISPLMVIIAVTIGGAYFGILGMFLGVPVAAILKILVNDYIDSRLAL